MKTLVVYASPNPKGNCAAIRAEVEAQLQERKQPYEVLDLYQMHYDPVLTSKEITTKGKKHPSSLTPRIQKKIRASKHLIFIYPLWWGSMPAILKGFFDKTLSQGFAFRYKPFLFKIGRPVALLKGKRAAVFMNSGAPVWLSRLYQGRRTVKNVKRDILGFCGITAKVFQTGPGNPPNAKKLEVVAQKVSKGLSYLYG